ncbi:hypothetical protein H5410_004717 [Solanum commersonii]|uniref:Uncharacterized protein n=1 Tax=Solanum commersonii TaxID=4109 RepID=A0A9J6A5C8_SOLCO|nr:hypothetical protein H5410_004717 [Solanum commersonii]
MKGSRELFNKHSAIGESYNINYIALRRSDQQSSSRRSTCNDEVIPDIPGDQIHLKEVYISYNINYRALRRSDQRSSSRRSTCNDEVLPDVPGDQIHLKEVYIILHLRNTLLKALESRRSLGEKNQENNIIVLTKIHQ